MKALVWKGGQVMDYEDVADPEAGGDEVVLDVQLAGICGSDLHGYRGHPGPRVPPLVLGHEVVGTVDGKSYAVYPLIGCGDCEHCAAGAENLCMSWRLIGMHRAGVFSERVLVPRASLVPLPDGLDPKLAVLAEPLACCVGALSDEIANAKSEIANRIQVLGAGPIGLLTVWLAAKRGHEVRAVDPVASRLETARLLGATDFEGPADLAVDAAGFEATWRAAIDAVKNGGTVVAVGLGQAEGTLPFNVIVRRAIRIRGQFAYSRADFAQAVELLAEGDLDLSWLTESPLAEGAQAFANLVERPADFSKVVLAP
jgi:threonine dehydrogenase-like Zn-dependent dehydrogenase